MVDSSPYDVNFCFPVRELENQRLRLSPFIPSVHAQEYWEATKDCPEIYIYFPFEPMSEDDFARIIETRVQPNPTTLVFAVLDKSSNGVTPPLAGLIGLLNASPDSLSAEIGWLITVPNFQRTHVTTNAIGLLLMWCLDPPALGGLGLRRVQYQSHPENVASRRKAERLGFRFEMVQRYQRVVAKADRWDSAIYSLCWDDWREGRARVMTQMERNQ
ncbi:acyl-CoA N-acyltransferase [Cristinia sonorae]|uniref:Acyl-CoA N-acyltransferase n=1 Tax=Cristinia sonorae TaxID=1940300 RepID=A0A8K0UWD3_9AGAR|nr:acyl-CoA N-acyltransferase [Cristinia sonorae]